MKPHPCRLAWIGTEWNDKAKRTVRPCMISRTQTCASAPTSHVCTLSLSASVICIIHVKSFCTAIQWLYLNYIISSSVKDSAFCFKSQKFQLHSVCIYYLQVKVIGYIIYIAMLNFHTPTLEDRELFAERVCV